MEYFVHRGEQKFGPYKLADLQRYVQSGNISIEDMVESEGTSGMVPVAAVLGNIAMPGAAAPIAAAPPVELVSLPPNLHWGLLLVLSLLTQNLLSIVWYFVMAAWGRRLNGSAKPLYLSSAGLASLLLGLAIASQTGPEGAGAIFSGLGFLVFGICNLVASFQVRDAIEDYYNSTENIGLKLSVLLTFFLNVIYFQYHVNKLTKYRRTGVYDSGGGVGPPPRIT